MSGPTMRRAAGTAAALLLFAATQTPTAVAAPVNLYEGAEEHYAGSQIAKHEGRGDTPERGKPLGNDVSGWQGDVNWASVKRKGGKFTYVKATEGTGFRNPHFTQQYNGSYDVGLIRGAYHFARPDVSGGAAQAKYFVRHGGRWGPDAKTLPGALDVEYNPYGDTCYGKSKRGMTKWIKSFVDTYADLVGRPPAIYTSTSWWKTCTGNTPLFGKRSPLWIARYNDYIGELPAGWPTHTIWQFSDSGKLPGDQNYFNGSMEQLRVFAAK